MSVLTRTPRVAVLGDLFVDILASGIRELPRWGSDAPARSIKIAPGGSALNTACCLSSLGTPSALFGSVGNDDFGRLLLEKAKEVGVDTEGVHVYPSGEEATAACIALSGAGDRAFVSTYGATGALKRSHIDLERLTSDFTHLHITGYFMLFSLHDVVVGIVQSCKDAGMTVSVDTGFDPTSEWKSNIRDVLALSDVFFPNEEEAMRIAGREGVENAALSLSLSTPLVVCTMGAQGCLAAQSGEELLREPAMDVTHVMDATGAGDAFTGGFLAEFLHSSDIMESLRVGTACAALCITREGACTYYPSLRADLKDILENNVTL